jgi:hypothetical protein
MKYYVNYHLFIFISLNEALVNYHYNLLQLILIKSPIVPVLFNSQTPLS